jgi:phosphohistidine swiveling domain-containing protein
MKDLGNEIMSRPWIFLGANALPLYITIYPPLYTFGFKQRFGQEAEIIYASEGKKAHWYMRGDQLDSLAKSFLPTLLEAGWQWHEQCVEELANFQDFNQRFLKQDLRALDPSALLTAMREYRESFESPFVTNNIIEALSYYFQHALRDLLLTEDIESTSADKLIEQYGQSAEPNYVKKCAQEYRVAQTDEERERVRQKYYFIFNDYAGPNETTHEELSKLLDTTPYMYAERFETVGISARAQKLLIAFQVVATVQDIRKAELLEMVTAARRFGETYARLYDIPFVDMEYATWYEIEDGNVRLTDLRARKDPFVAYWSLEGVQIHTGDAASRLIAATHTHILKLENGLREVKGVCASKGRVTGRAVVIFEPSEFSRVREGDVLFTMMTRPEFLPIMHQAAAFVCDEGGLTSHAAIVAREMKKPCIVATRMGTRVFKDGDTVDVDATTGIVRKI